MFFKKMINKKNLIIIFILFIIAIAGLFIFLNITLLPDKTDNVGLLNNSLEKQQAVLNIDYGNADVKTFYLEFRQGDTIFDLLQKTANESNIELETKNYDAGVFIESISGKKNGENGKYWLYYVNGQMPMLSADKNEVRPGDKVEFKFEESSF